MKKLITLTALVMLTSAVFYAGLEGTDSECCHWNYIQHLTESLP